MSYPQLQQMFTEAMQIKTCWGAGSVRPLLIRVLDEYQMQYGTLPTAGFIIYLMDKYVAKKPGWGRNELARNMANIIDKAEALQ